MRSDLLCFVILFILFEGSLQYNSYPRRYVRDQSSREICPSQCRCMNLNQRSARGLFDSWNIGRSWQNTEPGDSGRSVVCQGLRELPADIPSDVTKLTVYGDSSSMRSRGARHLISDTQVQYINRNTFRNSLSIKEIVMSGNNIAIMYPSAFHYLRSLEKLSLTNNNIRHLSAAAFNGLSHLQELRLSDNMIRFIPYALFTYLTEMKSLYLNGNKIKRLSRDVFKSLQHLQILDLSRNNISDLYDEIFDKNTDLQELQLNGNRLWTIRPRWFQNLYSLRTLSLRGNAIVNVPADSFANLFRLEELLLSANHIEEMEDGAFSNLRDLKSLDLSTNDLSEIRSIHLSDLDSLTELFLSNNKLVKISNTTFDHTRYLNRLDLSRNDISQVGTGSFNKLRQLQVLDLSHNKMKKVPGGFVYGADNLEEVHLDNNFISEIDNGAFITSNVLGLAKLTKVQLENNDLRKIEANTFKGMPRLKTLDLGNNKIRKIHEHAFSPIAYLETLNLNNNNLRSINNGIFRDLRKVFSIDLSKNKIGTIDDNTLLGLDSLDDLILSGNKINSMHKLALRAVRNLKTLDLKDNRLISFNFSYITNMPELTVLDFTNNHLFWIDIPQGAYLRLKDLLLSHNNLQSLSSNIGNIMGRSSIISLDNNPWTCDCNLKWMVQPNPKMRIDSTMDVMCKEPHHLHGKKITELAEEDMTCNTPSNDTNNVTLTCKDDVFSKRQSSGRRSIGKELMQRHVTVFRNRGDYVTDGVMLNAEWALVPAGALKYLSSSDLYAKIGRTKTSFTITNIVEHPLLSMGMQRFNVALLRLVHRQTTPSIENQCILTEKQLSALLRVLPRFSVSIRLDGKKPKTKLKIRKGKITHNCANDKDYICGILKSNKKNVISSVEGAPIYVGHSSNLRLAGIGTRSWSNQKSQFIFIPLWTIAEWVDDVIKEFDVKCKQKKGNFICEKLRLPLANELYMKTQNTERH